MQVKSKKVVNTSLSRKTSVSSSSNLNSLKKDTKKKLTIAVVILAFLFIAVLVSYLFRQSVYEQSSAGLIESGTYGYRVVLFENEGHDAYPVTLTNKGAGGALRAGDMGDPNAGFAAAYWDLNGKLISKFNPTNVNSHRYMYSKISENTFSKAIGGDLVPKVYPNSIGAFDLNTSMGRFVEKDGTFYDNIVVDGAAKIDGVTSALNVLDANYGKTVTSMNESGSAFSKDSMSNLPVEIKNSLVSLVDTNAGGGGGYNRFNPVAINNSDVVGGQVFTQTNMNAYVWKDSKLTNLQNMIMLKNTSPLKDLMTSSFVSSINNSGYISGSIFTPGYYYQGVGYIVKSFSNPAKPEVQIFKSKRPNSDNNSIITIEKINDDGMAVLIEQYRETNGSDVSHAYLVNYNNTSKTWIDIDALVLSKVKNVTNIRTFIFDLNNIGQVSGYAQLLDSSNKSTSLGFIYNYKNGEFKTLDQLSSKITNLSPQLTRYSVNYTYEINEKGQILGECKYASNSQTVNSSANAGVPSTKDITVPCLLVPNTRLTISPPIPSIPPVAPVL
jgi:hypothetical protein